MSQQDFMAALEQELRLRGAPFDRGALIEFVENVWAVAQDEPDVARWADAFLAGVAG